MRTLHEDRDGVVVRVCDDEGGAIASKHGKDVRFET